MTKDEALKLALQLISNLRTHSWTVADEQLVITAIKEALAQPEQEPVAWRAWVSKFPQGTGSDWVYVTKPIMKDKIHNQPLYTTLPQRKPLTDEEICPWFQENTALTNEAAMRITRAIETAHGIKGEA